ncbi:MAG: ABC transporter permease, partial [Nocardioidaceae bacterium]
MPEGPNVQFGSGQPTPTLDAMQSGERPPAGGEHADREFTVEQRSQFQLIAKRFLQHKLAVVSLAVFVLLILVAFLSPLFWPYSYTDINSPSSLPPSGKHLFGTDSVGHDVFARVMRGTQRSLEVALAVTLIATTVGTVWGTVAGFFRGWADAIMMRVSDLILTLPLIVVAAVIANGTSGSWWMIALVIGGLQWAYVSRVARGVVLSLREKEYIEASKAMGSSSTRIIFRHLIPNALGTIIVNATILVAVAILAATALSFLGFGIQPPDVSLGGLVSHAQTAVQTRPWLFYFPGLFIILIALTIN